MAQYLSTRGLEKELIDRGLLPAGCRLIEVSIAPGSALVLRYEKFVTGPELGLVADALKATAVAEAERHNNCEICAPQEFRLEGRRCARHQEPT